jgi:predicted transcriptional regulator
MTEGLITVPPSMPMRDAAKLLLDEKIDSLGVKKDTEMIGILNKTNVLHALADLK